MNVKNLELKAKQIRLDIVDMLYNAGSGHPAGALGLADIFTVLYFDVLKHDSKKPNWKDRDYVILSNGHVCPVLYAILANCGYFPRKKLQTLRKLGSPLQGHPHNLALPGIENSSGPLGQGISQAVGLAAVLKRDKKKNHVYCFVGDGELEEGQVWGALLFAAKEKLDNLVVIVDKNNIQIDGNIQDVSSLEPLNRKFNAFNFKTISFDGNSIVQIKHAFKHAKNIKAAPVCLIANTVSGKGVSFMEKDFVWHGKTIDKEHYELAIKDLNN